MDTDNSNITKFVGYLENWLGYSLLVRHPRGTIPALELTPGGERFFDRARQIMHLLYISKGFELEELMAAKADISGNFQVSVTVEEVNGVKHYNID